MSDYESAKLDREMKCYECDRVLPAGTPLSELKWVKTKSGKKAPAHKEEPKVSDPNIPTKSPAPGTASSGAPNGPGDPPIYTYHRRHSTGNSTNDWIEYGVSSRGRKLGPDDVGWVNDQITAVITRKSV